MREGDRVIADALDVRVQALREAMNRAAPDADESEDEAPPEQAGRVRRIRRW
jgi:hypothetical protein